MRRGIFSTLKIERSELQGQNRSYKRFKEVRRNYNEKKQKRR